MAGDYLELRLEETPTPQGADTTQTPYRRSSDVCWMPVTSSQLTLGPAPLSRADEVRNIEGQVPDVPDMYAPAGALAVRGYFNQIPFLLPLAGWIGVPTAGGAGVTSPDTAKTIGSHSSGATTLNLDPSQAPDGFPARDFPASGQVLVSGMTVTYTGKTGTTLTGCSGVSGSIAAGSTVQGLIPSGVTRWVFTKRSALLAQTAQLRQVYGDEGEYLRGQGYALSQLSMDATGALSGTWLGLVLERLASDPALTPAFDVSAILPARRRDLHLSWLGGGATISDFSFQIASPLEAVATFTGQPYPDRMEYGADRVAVTGSAPKRQLSTVDWDAIANATAFAAKARWKSDETIGVTGYPYGMWLEMPACQPTGGDPAGLTNARRFDQGFDWAARWDETAGYDAKFTIACATASVYTWA